jgi:hypothetical protein
MKSKTLQLIQKYSKILKEQGELEGQQMDATQDVGVTDVTQPPVEQELPFTAESENDYIMQMLYSAKFEPTPEQNTELDNLIDKMKSKEVKNSRTEILPIIQQMISSEVESIQLRDLSDQID